MAAKDLTGTRDKTFDLISCVYHALQAVETCAQYREDARRAGDSEIVDFFDGVIEANRAIADQGKDLLEERLGRAGEKSANEIVDEQSMESFPASDAPAH